MKKVPAASPRAASRRLVATAVAAAIAPAWAQQPTGDTTTDGQTIVVTAQKRKQALEDVPIAITVLSQDGIEKSGGGSLEDIQQLLPSLSVDNQSGFNVVTMRGVGGGGRNIGYDPRVGVYLDGIYLGQAQALRMPLFDIEQMEVLRGPQGHLFGRNTVAGAVNITTRAPGAEPDGYLRAVGGNAGVREVFGSISGPLAEHLFGKISLATEEKDGYVRNLYDGSMLDGIKRATGRAQLALQITDRLKVNLTADRSHGDQKTINGEPVTDTAGGPIPGGLPPTYTVNFNTPFDEKVDLSGSSVTVNYVLEGGNSLTAVVGKRSTRQAKRSDNDYSPLDLLWTYYVDDFKQTSGEVRLASSNSASARYVVGLFSLGETARTTRMATVGNDWFAPGAFVSNDGKVKTRTWALFGAVDYDIARQLTLNLGARYTHETKDILFNLGGPVAPLFGIGTLDGFTDSRAESRLSPTVGATYAVSREQNLYAKFSRGFKSGGWNADYIDPEAAKHPQFSSESVDSWEIGTKGRLDGGRLRYDLSIYASRYADFQVNQFVALAGGGTSIELRNAAEVTSRGMDGSLGWRATPNLEIGANVGVVNAHFKSFTNCSPTVDCTGHRLPYAPDMTAAMTINYRLPVAGGRMDFYGEYSFRDKSFADPVNDESTQRIPSRDLVNLRVAYTPVVDSWTVSLWVRNAFDKDAITLRGRDFLGTQIVRRMEPRTVGLEARYNFF